MHGFKPMLGSNEPFDLRELKFPLLASIKKDGVRGVIRGGKLVSRSHMSQELPLIKNKQIQEMANVMKAITNGTNTVIDCELYVHGLPLNEIIMFTNSEDIKNRTHLNKIKSKVGELTKPVHYYTSIPKEFTFEVFDYVIDPNMFYEERMEYLRHSVIGSMDRVNLLLPVRINNLEELVALYEKSLADGFEGLVLRTPESPYKFGRSTFREGYFLKMKPIEEYEAIVVEINERLFNYNESTESFGGYSIKSKTVDNREGSGIAATATVMWNGHTFKVSLNGTEVERVKMWEERDKYVGKKLLFKGMSYGMKDVPRMPRFVKFIN